MHRPRVSTSRITIAALAAFAAVTGLGGQREARVREDGTTYSDFQRAVRKRIEAAGGWVGGAHPHKPNRNARRKRALLSKGVARAHI